MDSVHAWRWMTVALTTAIVGCGGGGAGGPDPQPAPAAQAQGQAQAADPAPPDPPQVAVGNAEDAELRALVLERGVTGDPTLNRALPDTDDPVVALGRALFFTKALGGAQDSACVTCHHPALGGGDGLSLPIGVGAVDPDVLAPDRQLTSGLPNVPRNAPTFFNLGLCDARLFHDGRVESLGGTPGAIGAGAFIRTPDSAFGTPDDDAGANLAAAQARFPVTSVEEMRSETFEPGSDNDTVRAHLASCIGGYDAGTGELTRNEWLPLFRAAFGAGAPQDLVTFDNIAFALGEYERATVLVDNRFFAFVRGDDAALTDEEKEGARLFYTAAVDDGGNCFQCHAGDLFSNEEHHTIAFPQFGPGKGDGDDDDFGRERETGLADDRYRFRTPTLLNVAQTAPYGHAGVYETLGQVLQHYNNPAGEVDDFFDDDGACSLEQFEDRADCATLYPNSAANSDAALAKLGRERNQGTTDFPDLDLNGDDRDVLVAFLGALTDPCTEDRACLDAFVPDADTENPDDLQIVAVDGNGNPL